MHQHTIGTTNGCSHNSMNQKRCYIIDIISQIKKDLCLPIWNHGNHGNMFNFHSYGCQKIQTKNPFIWILGLGFSLSHLNMNTYFCQREPILSFERTHIIKTFWWKQKDIKFLLVTFKTFSCLYACYVCLEIGF
jgi:hypothetical protein